MDYANRIAQIRERLFANNFIYDVRLHGVINEGQYDELLKIIDDLLSIWSGKSLVEKDIVSYIFVFIPMLVGFSEEIRKKSGKENVRLDEIIHELEGRIIDLLA